MLSLENKLAEWTRDRRRFELETRVLVVDDELEIRRQLDGMLYRMHIASRSVVSTEQAMELVGTGSYPLLLVSENLSGMGGLYLIRHIRRTVSAVDALVSTWQPSLELLGHAFELRLLDIVRKPLAEPPILGEQIRSAISRNLDRRMRRFLVQELRASLGELPEKLRTPTIQLLEQRLTAFKGSVGAFNRVLVVEGDDADLRRLGEQLLLCGLYVETALSLDMALARIRAGDVHMLVASADSTEPDPGALVNELRATSPMLEVLLVSADPDIEQARAALVLGAAGCFSWPPPSMPALVSRVHAILKRCRHERLLDNLVVELFRETSRALGCPPGSNLFGRFFRLVGMERVAPEPPAPLVRAATSEAVEYLDDVLDDLLSPEAQQAGAPEEVPASSEFTDTGTERRSHPRVPENQFIRFRAASAPSSRLALVGDLSEGGLFIRTSELLAPSTPLQLEFQVAHETRAYLVCCRGKVAWVARNNRQSPLGPGLGIKFIDAPQQVVALLKQIVETRISQAAK